MTRRRAPPSGSDGILVGVPRIAQAFGVSPRTIWRWAKFHGFPVGTLPSGHSVSSVALIDAWILGRLKRPLTPTIGAPADEIAEGGDVDATPQSRESS